MSLTWKSQDPADGGGGGCSFAKDGEGGCFGRADDGAEAAAAAKALATTSGSFTLSGCSEPAAATKASVASARCFTLIGFFWRGGEHHGVLDSDGAEAGAADGAEAAADSQSWAHAKSLPWALKSR